MADAVKFPEGSSLSNKTQLECSLYVRNVIFDGDIKGVYFEAQCEADPEMSVHTVEFNEHSNITFHTLNGVIQFWGADDVEFDYRGQELIVRPRRAAA